VVWHTGVGPAAVRLECAIISSVESATTTCLSFKILKYWDIHYRWYIFHVIMLCWCFTRIYMILYCGQTLPVMVIDFVRQSRKAYGTWSKLLLPESRTSTVANLSCILVSDLSGTRIECKFLVQDSGASNLDEELGWCAVGLVTTTLLYYLIINIDLLMLPGVGCAGVMSAHQTTSSSQHHDCRLPCQGAWSASISTHKECRTYPQGNVMNSLFILYSLCSILLLFILNVVCSGRSVGHFRDK